MRKEVKFIVGTNLIDLENQLNNYLCGVDADTTITYDFEKSIAVVEVKSVCAKSICAECKHWDDGGNNQALIGECRKCQLRKRYNDGSCSKYERR